MSFKPCSKKVHSVKTSYYASLTFSQLWSWMKRSHRIISSTSCFLTEEFIQVEFTYQCLPINAGKFSQTRSFRLVWINLLNFQIHWLTLPLWTKLIGLCIGWGVRRRAVWITNYIFIFRIIGLVGSGLVV